MLRLIYSQGHFSLILIHMGATDIDRGHPEVTTSSEHLGKEPGDPDKAPVHPMAKENVSGGSNIFLRRNEPQDPTKTGKFSVFAKRSSPKVSQGEFLFTIRYVP